MNELKDFLEIKFGEEITKRLFDGKKLTPEKTVGKNKKDQKLVVEQLEGLKDLSKIKFKNDKEIELPKDNKNQKLDLDLKNTRWAFDFPGFIGEFNGSKEIMIIGLEPHVECYDFQITYGLSEKTPFGEERFECNNNTKKTDFPVLCKDDSSLIWSNIFKIFNEEKQCKDDTSLKNFLERFYITDLCHFAPQDHASAIKGVKKWDEIRKNVAEKFLKREIEIVKPKIILAQGKVVFYFLKDILKFDKILPEAFVEYGKRKQYIRFGEKNINDEKITIIGLPHLGTSRHRKFYQEKSNDIREILRKKLPKEIFQKLWK